MPWVQQDDGRCRRVAYLVAGTADGGAIAHIDYDGEEPPATSDSSSSRPRAKKGQRPRKLTVSNKEDGSKRRRPRRLEETPSGAHHS